MINDASVVIGGGNWGIKEADVLGYKLINEEYYARDIDFANSTAAGTYTDSTGVIRKAPYNLLTWSEQFDNGVWVKPNVTIGIDSTVAPNGTMTADTLTANGTTSSKEIYQSSSVISGNVYTFSIYAKKGTNDFFQITGGGGTFGSFFANFDLNNGVVGSSSFATNVNIQSVGDGWYRCSASATAIATATGNAFFVVIISSATSARLQSNSLSTSIFIWGAQLVEGTEALPYFPTTTRLNVPRIDYRNADGSLSTVGRLLLEPQRTNNAQFSEAFDNAYWTKSNATVTSTLGGPIANSKYFTITCDATTGRFKGVGKSFLNASANTYSLSVFAKAGTSSAFVVSSRDTLTDNDTFARFNLANGTIISQNGGTASIVNYGDGWYRCTFVVVNAGTFTNEASIFFGHPHGAADGATVLATGATSEIGAYPTTYIPTTTASVTRNADSASRTGVSSWIGQTEGTLFVDLDGVNGLDNPEITLDDNTNNNRIVLNRSIVTGFWSLFTASAGVSGQTSSSVSSNNGKFAIAYNSTNYVVYRNGVLILTRTAALPVSLSAIRLNGRATNDLYGAKLLAEAAIFPTRLTNEQLSQITTL